MNSKHIRSSVLAAAVAGLLTSGVVAADDTKRTETERTMPQDRQSAETQAQARTDREEMREEARDSQELVNEARGVVAQMKRDAQLTNLLQRAQGVYIVPDFGKVAVGVGGRGGEGVLLLNRDGQWTGPAFYNFGRFSAGLQAGASAGSVAMLLMTQDAVQPFTAQKNNFALDATAGLTIVNYSAEGRATAGEPDVVMWSDTEGLFAGASIGVTGFVRDEEENRAYYRKQTSVQEIFSGTAKNPHADALREALPARTAAR